MSLMEELETFCTSIDTSDSLHDSLQHLNSFRLFEQSKRHIKDILSQGNVDTATETSQGPSGTAVVPDDTHGESFHNTEEGTGREAILDNIQTTQAVTTYAAPWDRTRTNYSTPIYFMQPVEQKHADNTLSKLDVLIEGTIDHAIKKARTIKEKHTAKRRQGNIPWLCGLLKQRTFTQNLSCIVVHDRLEMVLCACDGAHVINRPVFESRKDMGCIITIFMKRDLAEIHVIVICDRKIWRFVVHLSKRIAEQGNSTLLQQKIKHPIHNEGICNMINPLLRSSFRNGKLRLPMLDGLRTWTSVSSLISLPLRLLQSSLLDTPNLSLTMRTHKSHCRLCKEPQQILCSLAQKVLNDALHRCKAAVFIQQRYRGFLVRRRISSIQNRDFAYQDCELDDILTSTTSIKDLIHFDESENYYLGGWSPRKPLLPSSTKQSKREEPEPKTKSKLKKEWRTMIQRRQIMKRGGFNGIALRSRR